MDRRQGIAAGLQRLGGALALLSALLLSGGVAFAMEGYDRTGEASWYGDRYNGRETASGALFDANGLTAAHRHLAFGTLVRVTNLDNQRAVFVRITDRGPYARGRLIDLSRRAAELLDFVRDGVAPVRVQVEPEAGSGRASSYLMPVTLRPPAGRLP